MIKRDSRGESTITPIKQDNLRGLLRTHFMVCKGIMARMKFVDQTYHWFDITAGCGHDECGNPGSATIFYEEAIRAGINFKAVMIDLNEDHCRQLNEKIPQGDNIDIRCGDHNQILPEYFGESTQWKLGMIYADANGIPSFDILAKASRVNSFKRTDILINCPATAIKRKGASRVELCDSINAINKKEWVIRTPKGAWQWSFLIGSNWMDFPAWQTQGFYSIRTDMGKLVMAYISKTKQEMAECQMKLWPTARMNSI